MAGSDAMLIGGQLNKLLGPGAPILAILEKIEKNTAAKEGGDGKGKSTSGKAAAAGEEIDMAAIASTATALTELVNAMTKAKSVDATLGTKIGKVIRDVVESIQDTIEQLDAAKVEAFAKLMDAVIGNAGKFMKEMAMYAILTPLTMLGVVGFGVSVNMLMAILSKAQAVDKAVTEGIATLMGAARGAFLFGLAMAAWLLLAPLAALGALVFTVVMFGMLSVFSMISASAGTTVTALAELMGMASGIALFALAMVAIAFLAIPFAIGTLVFAVVVGALLLIFGLVAMATPTVGVATAALAMIGGTSIMLTLAFIAIGFFAVKFAIGALVFAVVVGAMLLIFGAVAALFPEVLIAAQAINMIGGVAFKLGLTFIAIGYFAKLFAIGALTFALTVGLMLLVFGAVATIFPAIILAAEAISMMANPILILTAALLVAGFFPTEVLMGGVAISIAIGLLAVVFGIAGESSFLILRGGRAISKMSAPVLAIGAAALVAGFFSKQVVAGALAIAAAIGVIGKAFAIAGASSVPIYAGAKVLLEASMPLAIFSGVILVISFFKPKDVVLGAGAVALGIILLAGAFAIAGIPQIAAAITVGALALLEAAIPLAVFSGVLLVISFLDPISVIAGSGALALSIILLAAAFAIVGIPFMSAAITVGAAALLLAGPGLGIFAGIISAISLLPLIDVAKISVFSGSILSISLSLAAVGFFGALVIFGGFAIEKAAYGLLTMVAAVAAFSVIPYDENTATHMSDMITSLSAALLVGFAILGNPISAFLVANGSYVLAMASVSIMVLAEAVAKMANLEVISMVVANPGTDKATLVPGESRKLKKSDFKNASNNITAMISSISDPLMEFGLAASVGSSLFTKGIMQKGLEMMPIMSESISTLAMGVAKMANLEVMTTTVVNAGTDKATIVPGETRKLDRSDFKNAAKNIKAILGSITEPLMEFGMSVDQGDNFFASGYLRKGLEIMPLLSDSIATLAEGVARMANLEIMTNTVANPGTDKATLVPGDIRKLSTSDFEDAAASIKAILGAVTQPLMDFGMAVDKSSGPFSNSYIYNGLDMFGKLSESMSTLAIGVAKMANLEVVTNVVANPGTKDAVIIPGTIVKLAQAEFKAAGDNIGAILKAIAEPLTTFGKALYVGSGLFADGYMTTGIEFFGVLTESMGTLAQGVQGMANLEVIINEVVDGGTKDAKIVPSDVKKLTNKNFTDAAKNIGDLLTTFTDPLTQFGRALSGMDPLGKEGFLRGLLTSAVSPKYMQMGLEGLGTLSESLGTLSEGVVKMANMEFIENIIINPGTSDAKVVPGKIRVVTPQNLTDAAANITGLVVAMFAPLTKFGRALSGMDPDLPGDPGFIGGLKEMMRAAVQPDFMKVGLEGLGTLSQSLGTLSEGMVKMAGMEFVENIVINPGTKDAKVVPGYTRKVTEKHMTDAADSMGKMLIGMTAPLTKFGRALSGMDPEESGDPGFIGGLVEMISSAVQPDYMQAGLDGLGILTTAIGTLGAGIISMANLEVAQYSIKVDPKTGLNVLQPELPIKLNATHFDLAAKGVSTILLGVMHPLARFGKNMRNGEGIFEGGYVEAGLTGLAMLSESLGGLAAGVISMASGEFVEQIIINEGTKDAKLVPGKITKLGTEHFEAARKNIAAILTGLAIPLSEFGTAWESDGTYKGGVKTLEFGSVKAGVMGLAAISEPISDLADSIIKLGGGQVVIQKVINGKLVPGNVLDMSGVLESAKTTLLDILTVFPTAFVEAGTYMQSNDAAITSVTSYLEDDILPSMELILETAGLYSKTVSTMELASKKKVPIEALILALDISMVSIGKTLKNDINQVALVNFTTFNTQMKKLADIATPFERFAKAFTQFSKDMGTFGKNFKVMTPDGIDAYRMWTDAVVTVAKTDFSAIEAKIQAMRDIAASIYKAGDPTIPNGDDEQTEEQKQEAIKNKNNNIVTNPDPNSLAGGGGGGGGGGNDGAAIAAAIKSALSNMTINNVYVKGQFNAPSDRRLKENIVRVGTSPLGIAIYEWKYIGIPGRYQGVMAQDLLETEHADAVIMVDEFYRVNYAKLDVKFQSI